jgi:uncharacterized NAD(P)/FAD-binding protein YdhS
MPPEVAAMLAALIGGQRLQAQGGSVKLFAAGAHTLEARVAGAPPLEVGLAINCTGPGLDPRASHDPLVGQLLGDGYVRAHPLGIGFDTATDGALRSQDGERSRRLFTLGPPRIGELYETTAIPEIRVQAQQLATRLLGALRPALSSRPARQAVSSG